MPQTKLRIRYYGDPVLRQRAKPVDKISEGDREILMQMFELMRLAGGVGLAAPQVGINKQFLVIDVGQGPVALINPRITKRKGSVVMEEGCLSLPGIYVKVKRAKKITICGFNELDERVTITAQDLLARAMQHEIDHLRGRMIVDYANLVEKIRLRKKLRDLKKRVADEL